MKLPKIKTSETFKNPLLQSFVIPESLKYFQTTKMHILQPKHSKMKPEEVKELVEKYNITVSQLPKIKIDDSMAPEGCVNGDVLKIERKFSGETRTYYRVVVG